MSFPRYPEYKDSGVEWLGELPAHWSVARLKQVADVRLSNVDKHSVETQPAVRLCNYVDVYKNDRITSVMEFMQATASEEQIARLSLLAGDVIITKDSEVPSDIGVPALVDETIPDLVCGYHLALIRPTHAVGGFLRYLFKSDYVKAVFEVEATGMTRYALGKYSIENLAHLAPPLEEQQAIAAFLDRETGKIDTLIAEQQRLVELLAEKRQAVISHAVTKGLNPNAPMKKSGIEWLGEVPAHWGCMPMKYLVRLRSGGTPSKERHDYWDGSIPWASGKDMKVETLSDTEDHITELAIEQGSATLIEQDAVLVVVRGMILARTFPVALTDERMAINQDLKAVLAGTKLQPAFLAWYLRGTADESLRRLDEAAHGTKALRMEAWTSMEIALPSLDEQAAIANLLGRTTSQLDTLTAEANRAIALLQERRSALISAAVTGKIDVRGQV
jgi:type I restriction enzyme S subunit